MIRMWLRLQRKGTPPRTSKYIPSDSAWRMTLTSSSLAENDDCPHDDGVEGSLLNDEEWTVEEDDEFFNEAKEWAPKG